MVLTRRHMLAAVSLAAIAGCQHTDSVPAPSARQFGVAIDPWQTDEWAAAVGAKPSLVMGFESFSNKRTLDKHFAEVKRQGVGSFMVTWEPWVSVDAALGKEAQHKLQPEYSNGAIASGQWDDYLRAFARSVKASGLMVYIRYAHEMNGDWYPWSRDPADYIAAWRRVVSIFRQEKADNARFVYSVNPSIWVAEPEFEQSIRQYWPGPEYVDHLGSTMINFGGTKTYTVTEFGARLAQMRAALNKDVIITELNTAADGRVKWLTDLRTWLTDATWVRAVVLSQGASRGQAQLGQKVGNLSWNVMTDPETQPVVKAIITDMAHG